MGIRARSATAEVHLGDPALAVDLLRRPGVLVTGHYRLLCGLHSDSFIAFSRVASDTAALDLIASWLTPTIAPWRCTAVLAPTTAGVGLASTLARSAEVPLYLATLDAVGRGVGLVGDPPMEGRRVVVVNDIVTTGTGLARLADTARVRGAEVVGGTWFASRAQVDPSITVDAATAHVMTVDLCAWESAICELCAGDVEIQDALDLN